MLALSIVILLLVCLGGLYLKYRQRIKKFVAEKAEERQHIRVGVSPDYTDSVLLIPCAHYSEQGLAVAIDPRYDRYDLSKFYAQHLRQGDLAICIQHHDGMERLLLTIRKS